MPSSSAAVVPAAANAASRRSRLVAPPIQQLERLFDATNVFNEPPEFYWLFVMGLGHAVRIYRIPYVLLSV